MHGILVKRTGNEQTPAKNIVVQKIQKFVFVIQIYIVIRALHVLEHDTLSTIHKSLLQLYYRLSRELAVVVEPEQVLS